MRQRDQAKIQMLCGQYAPALDALEATSRLLTCDPATGVRHLLMQTECLEGLGRRSEAQETYARAAQSLQTHHLAYLSPAVQEVERRLA